MLLKIRNVWINANINWITNFKSWISNLKIESNFFFSINRIGSWIELENKTNNEKTNDTEAENITETSPTTSNHGDQDEAAMTQALADAQDELSRR